MPSPTTSPGTTTPTRRSKRLHENATPKRDTNNKSNALPLSAENKKNSTNKRTPTANGNNNNSNNSNINNNNNRKKARKNVSSNDPPTSNQGNDNNDAFESPIATQDDKDGAKDSPSTVKQTPKNDISGRDVTTGTAGSTTSQTPKNTPTAKGSIDERNKEENSMTTPPVDKSAPSNEPSPINANDNLKHTKSYNVYVNNTMWPFLYPLESDENNNIVCKTLHCNWNTYNMIACKKIMMTFLGNPYGRSEKEEMGGSAFPGNDMEILLVPQEPPDNGNNNEVSSLQA
jgi:hypothetical protein